MNSKHLVGTMRRVENRQNKHGCSCDDVVLHSCGAVIQGVPDQLTNDQLDLMLAAVDDDMQALLSS